MRIFRVAPRAAGVSWIPELQSGVSTDFVINERDGFEFRAEAYDFINHPNWGTINLNPTSRNWRNYRKVQSGASASAFSALLPGIGAVMKRRSLLKGLGTLPAANLLKAQQPVVPPKPAPAAVDEIPVIESTIPDSAADTIPGFFSKDQFEALLRLCDILYPAIKDVPGALAAGVPAFLDFLVGQSPATVQRNYRNGLDALNQRSQEQFRVPFGQTKTPQSESILTPLREPWSANADDFTAFLRDVKEDVLKATQNSQEWSSIMSKRIRSSAGVGFYWFPID